MTTPPTAKRIFDPNEASAEDKRSQLRQSYFAKLVIEKADGKEIWLYGQAARRCRLNVIPGDPE